MRASSGRRHISGAETLTDDRRKLDRLAAEYTRRALNHPRGRAEKIVVTVEELTSEPERITSLPVFTIKELKDPWRAIAELLALCGVSGGAADRAGELVLSSDATMRGAALMLADSGKRVEPDAGRGVRVSRLGLSESARRELSVKLSRQGINTATVREALALASKTALHPAVAAELCVSDDPDYTTGYVASGSTGYLRLQGLKSPGDPAGGRVIFLKPAHDPAGVMDYLERTPVLINKTARVSAPLTLDEFLDSINR